MRKVWFVYAKTIDYKDSEEDKIQYPFAAVFKQLGLKLHQVCAERWGVSMFERLRTETGLGSFVSKEERARY